MERGRQQSKIQNTDFLDRITRPGLQNAALYFKVDDLKYWRDLFWDRTTLQHACYRCHHM